MKTVSCIQQKTLKRIFESPYIGRDFVQFGKTKSVLNKRAQRLALLFNPPSVLSLEIMVGSKIKISDMLYQSDDKKESWEIFQRDYRLGEVELDQLKYGFVDTYEEYSTSSQEFAEEFSEAEDVWKMLME